MVETFSVYLTEEVFGRQPMKVYFRKSSNQLLKSGLAVYLECHTNALYGAHETLPTLIQKTVGEFMRISNESSDAKRAEYTSKVCAAIAKYSPMAYKLVANPSMSCIRRLEDDPDDSIWLCIAVATGDTGLIQNFLARGTSIWRQTNCFGASPLGVAARSNLNAVRLLLRDPQATDNSHPSPLRSKVLSGIIDEKIKSRTQAKLAVALMKWHARYIGPPKDAFCNLWLKSSRFSDNADVVAGVLDLGFTNRLASMYRREYLRGWRGSYLDTHLRLFIEKGVFSTDKIYKYTLGPWTPRIEGSLLYWLVQKYNNVEPFEIALKAGAHPDGLHLNGRLEYPLRVAIANRDDEVRTARYTLEQT